MKLVQKVKMEVDSRDEARHTEKRHDKKLCKLEMGGSRQSIKIDTIASLLTVSTAAVTSLL